MALYELGITSLGRRPVKFNGALNLWNERERTWNEGYTFHNQHSTYAPVYAANHAELADNFHDWLARVRGETVKAAAELFGIDGAYFPEYMSHDFTLAKAREWTGPDKKFELAYILSTGVRACLLLWDRYRYTLDTAFLRAKAYPVIRDVAEFYVNYGKLGADGLYHVEPSLSWEERPLGRDGHADCAAWRTIFTMALAAAATLGVDAERCRVWQERLRLAPPYPLDNGRFSVVMRRDGTPEPTNHFQWQLPNLSAVYPYNVIGIGSPRHLRQLAEATFDRYRFNGDAGHEYLPVVAARLGRADWWRGALYLFQQFFQNYDQGLFNYYSMVGNKDEESANRESLLPYLEGSGIFATAVNEMLLQSHDGVIRVFPAAPAAWQCRFILRAAGSFLVASEQRAGPDVPYILVQPLGGQPRECRVAVPWPQGCTLTAAGVRAAEQTCQDKPAEAGTPNGSESRLKPVNSVNLTCMTAGVCQKGFVTFTARPGVIYALTPRGVKLEDVPLEKIRLRTDCSPSRLGMTWYGLPESANAHTNSFPIW